MHGKVKPVGGVVSKIEAARKAGIKRAIIPEDNWLNIFTSFSDIEIIPVNDLQQVFDKALISPSINI